MQPGLPNGTMKFWLAVADELAASPAAHFEWQFLDQVLFGALTSNRLPVVDGHLT